MGDIVSCDVKAYERIVKEHKMLIKDLEDQLWMRDNLIKDLKNTVNYLKRKANK